MKKLLLGTLLLCLASSARAQVTFTVKGGSNFGKNEGCNLAFDHNLNTKWYGQQDDYVVFEASAKVQLTGYTFITANDNEKNGRCPKEWEIFGSNDEASLNDATYNSWESITYVREDKRIEQKNYTAYYFALNTAKAYKYYRLKIVVANNGSKFQISEFIPSYVPEFVPNYVAVSGMGGEGSEGYKSICDGNTSSKVCTNEGAPTPYFYFIFRRNEAVAIDKYRFCTGNDFKGRDPMDWELYGMNTDGTPGRTDAAWELIDRKTGQSLPDERSTWAEFNVETPTGKAYNTFMLKITKVRDGGDMTQFREFGLNSEATGYTVLDGVGGTGDEGYAKGFDGDTSTKVCTNSRVVDSYAYWFIFKTASELAVSGYKFATGNDATERDPQSWSLYGMKAGSDPGRDAEGWTLIDSKSNVTNFPSERMAWVHYDVDNPTAEKYNYFKLEVTKLRNDTSNDKVQFSEFNIDELDVNAENRLVAYRGMGTWNDGALANLFDGTSSTKFGGDFSTADNGAYVTFGPANQQAVSITGYSLQTANEWENYDRRPKSWTLYGGNDSSAPQDNLGHWEEIHTVTDDTELPQSPRACKYVRLDAPTKPYKYFKLKVTANQGSTGLQIAEFTLFYNHDAVSPWLEVREETAPVINGIGNVEHINVSRGITEGQWIGLCLPFDYDVPSGWDVRELKSVSGSGTTASMMFEGVSVIEAGKPYLVKTESAVTFIEAADKTIASDVQDVTLDGITMHGNLAQTSIPQGSYYINTSSQLKRLTAESATLKGFRAYFTVEDAAGIKALGLDLDDDATGLEMDNLQMYNVQTPVFNLAGQRMQKVQKGVNIINGKKVLY